MSTHAPALRRRFALLGVCGLLGLAWPTAHAQPQPADAAVDRGVSDVDPLAASQRVIDPGLGGFTRDTSVARNPALGSPLSPNQGYVYSAPGLRALMDRPSYLVVDREGRLNRDVAALHDDFRFLTIPANTVFSLTLPTARPAAAPAPAPQGMVGVHGDPRVAGFGHRGQAVTGSTGVLDLRVGADGRLLNPDAAGPFAVRRLAPDPVHPAILAYQRRMAADAQAQQHADAATQPAD